MFCLSWISGWARLSDLLEHGLKMPLKQAGVPPKCLKPTEGRRRPEGPTLGHGYNEKTMKNNEKTTKNH